MLQQHNENDDLDDWEKYAEREYEEREEEKEDETITFSVKLQSIKEKELKEEIERTNQQTVNDLFKVNKLPSIKNALINATNSNAIKTKTDYRGWLDIVREKNKMPIDKLNTPQELSEIDSII